MDIESVKQKMDVEYIKQLANDVNNVASAYFQSAYFQSGKEDTDRYLLAKIERMRMLAVVLQDIYFDEIQEIGERIKE